MEGNDEKKGKPIWAKENTVVDLVSLKAHPRDSYDDVIRMLIDFRRAHSSCPGIPVKSAPVVKEVVSDANTPTQSG
ncbi:MAG: hypothetical protein PHU04_05685 [Candidatus Peribacteraceae bacterium]|nr:hypothetical protein [Candidatus Peribacteraceae bacterium]